MWEGEKASGIGGLRGVMLRGVMLRGDSRGGRVGLRTSGRIDR